MDIIINGADFSAVAYNQITTEVVKLRGKAINSNNGGVVEGVNYVSCNIAYPLAYIDDVVGYMPDQVVFFKSQVISSGSDHYAGYADVNKDKNTLMNAIANAPSGATHIAFNFVSSGATAEKAEQAMSTPTYLVKEEDI